MLDVRRDANGDHVLRDVLAKVNRGVEPGSDEINPTVISRDLQYDVRVIARELSQLRSEDGLCRKARTQQPHTTDRLRLQSREGRQRPADVRECRAQVCEQLLARISR